jgi:anti-anti-sigma factor
LSDTPVSGSGWPEEYPSHSGLSLGIAVGELLLSLESHEFGTVIVAVAGDVDLLIADRLREVLIEQISARPEILVLDLAGVRFFGSTGLTALALARRVASEEGVDLRVVATDPPTLCPLRTC